MTIDESKLNEGQRKAMELVMKGRNVLILGYAGTGKSALIHAIVQKLEKDGSHVLVCAPTGISAITIEGVTIHSAFGLPADCCIKNAASGSGLELCVSVTPAVSLADVIIIDEISMVRMDLFDTIVISIKKSECKSGRHKQLICVGDFGQLPPVYQKNGPESILMDAFYGFYSNHAYAFEGRYWEDCNFAPVFLTEIVRQKDKDYAEALLKLWNGDDSCLDYFNQAVGRELPEDIVSLHAYNRDVDAWNSKHLHQFEGEEYTFAVRKQYEPSFSENNVDKQVATQIPELLKFKIGSSIIFTSTGYSIEAVRILAAQSKNYQNQGTHPYVNGMTGTIVGIGSCAPSSNEPDSVIIKTQEGDYLEIEPIGKSIMGYVEDESGLVKKKIATYTQYPFKLAHAQTMHKAQGQTYSMAIINPANFIHGQLYVALSRVTGFEGLFLTREIRKTDIIIDQTVIAFYDKMKKQAGISKRRGRPASNPDGSKKTKDIYVPLPLENHAREEIRMNCPITLKEYPEYRKGRKHFRVSEKIYDHMVNEIKQYNDYITKMRHSSSEK